MWVVTQWVAALGRTMVMIHMQVLVRLRRPVTHRTHATLERQ